MASIDFPQTLSDRLQSSFQEKEMKKVDLALSTAWGALRYLCDQEVIKEPLNDSDARLRGFSARVLNGAICGVMRGWQEKLLEKKVRAAAIVVTKLAPHYGLGLGYVTVGVICLLNPSLPKAWKRGMRITAIDTVNHVNLNTTRHCADPATIAASIAAAVTAQKFRDFYAVQVQVRREESNISDSLNSLALKAARRSAGSAVAAVAHEFLKSPKEKTLLAVIYAIVKTHFAFAGLVGSDKPPSEGEILQEALDVMNPFPGYEFDHLKDIGNAFLTTSASSSAASSRADLYRID